MKRPEIVNTVIQAITESHKAANAIDPIIAELVGSPNSKPVSDMARLVLAKNLISYMCDAALTHAILDQRNPEMNIGVLLLLNAAQTLLTHQIGNRVNRYEKKISMAVYKDPSIYSKIVNAMGQRGYTGMNEWSIEDILEKSFDFDPYQIIASPILKPLIIAVGSLPTLGLPIATGIAFASYTTLAVLSGALGEANLAILNKWRMNGLMMTRTAELGIEFPELNQRYDNVQNEFQKVKTYTKILDMFRYLPLIASKLSPTLAFGAYTILTNICQQIEPATRLPNLLSNRLTKARELQALAEAMTGNPYIVTSESWNKFRSGNKSELTTDQLKLITELKGIHLIDFSARIPTVDAKLESYLPPLNFFAPFGKLTLVTAPSGVGKSVSLEQALTGLITHKGSVYISDQEIGTREIKDLSKMEVDETFTNMDLPFSIKNFLIADIFHKDWYLSLNYNNHTDPFLIQFSQTRFEDMQRQIQQYLNINKRSTFELKSIISPKLNLKPEQITLFIKNEEQLQKAVATLKSLVEYTNTQITSLGSNLKNAINPFSQVSELSSGMQQRMGYEVAIRRMSKKPKCIVLDEPLSRLDEKNAKEHLETISTLLLKYPQTAIIIISHAYIQENVGSEGERVPSLFTQIFNDKLNTVQLAASN